MLEIVEAHFQNYRLLRDTRVAFSTGRERPLTVIRAENESGKTTLLTALQWAFFGDDALPTLRGGQRYRLHPLDWDTSRQGRRVEIRAEVTFRFRSLTTTPTGGEQELENEYVLQRIAEEQLGDGNAFDRFTRQPTLLQRTQAGYTPIETNPAVLIDSMIPYSSETPSGPCLALSSSRQRKSMSPRPYPTCDGPTAPRKGAMTSIG